MLQFPYSRAGPSEWPWRSRFLEASLVKFPGLEQVAVSRDVNHPPGESGLLLERPQARPTASLVAFLLSRDNYFRGVIVPPRDTDT